MLVALPFSLCDSENRDFFQGQSLAQLKAEFRDIRNHFNSRYVRLYGACDRDGF